MITKIPYVLNAALKIQKRGYRHLAVLCLAAGNIVVRIVPMDIMAEGCLHARPCV